MKTTRLVRSENRAVIPAGNSSELKDLARELDLPIIALSQLTRRVERRGYNRPIMSDLRGDRTEQDADIIIVMFREEVYEVDTPRRGVADLIVGKHRNGPVGAFHLTFKGEFEKFESCVTEA